MSLKRSVVVTGSNGGIGVALCAAFKAANYHVIATDSQVGEAISDGFIKMDLARFCRDEVYRLQSLAELKDAIQGGQLNALINNAAMQIVKPVEALTATDWQMTLDVNLIAPFLLTQQLLDFLEAGHGSVVNIASIHAQLTKPEFVCYATSKAALVGLTRSMAVELGERIRVNAICPAAIETEMLLAGFQGKELEYNLLKSVHPTKCIGKPEEVATLAVFMSSADCHFMNGGIYSIDGGMGARLHDPV